MACLGVAAVTVCVGLALAGVLLWTIDRPGPARLAPVNRIAYVGGDGNIYTANPDGMDIQPITTEAATDADGTRTYFRYPTWSPDSRRLAFESLTVDAQGDIVETTIHTVNLDTGERTVTEDLRFPPFYLFWSPNGRYLALLSHWNQGHVLRLLDVAGGGTEIQILEHGTIFFLAWSPDSEKLLVHIGTERLEILELTGDGRPEPLPGTPASFQAPFWSSDSQYLLFAVRDRTGDSRLVQTDTRGEELARLLSFRGLLQFALAPTGDHLAYITTQAGLGLPWGPLKVLELTGEQPRQLSEGPVPGAFWAPDGRHLAYLTVESRAPESSESEELLPVQGEEQIWLRWHVADVVESASRTLTAFRPSREFVIDYLRFFDQYAYSVTIWSPDSRFLVYAGQGESGEDGIWVLDTGGEGPARHLDEGSLAAWSWR